MGKFPVHETANASALDSKGASIKWMLPAEIPVGLIYGEHQHAVMMATPAELHDFAIGFSLAEGIVHTHDEVLQVREQPKEHGIELHIRLLPKRQEHLQMVGQRRSQRGRAGCGICGVDRLSDALRPLPVLPETNNLAPASIQKAVSRFAELQPMRQINRTVHGAAWVLASGEIELVREDIGRHNALDKMIGAQARQGFMHGFALLSSRCTYELVQKCAMAGIGSLVCLAAPTLNAVETAKAANIQLVIFDRKTRQCLRF